MTDHMTPSAFRDLALAQVGKPYVLGAEVSLTDPNPPRFDCSELVQWLYARSGNKITDGAWLQYNATETVKGSPQVGDLVFLRNNPDRPNGIGHVAVLTKALPNGDWEIVEARGRASGVVKTSLSYWKARRYFTGPRRLEGFQLAPEAVVEPPVAPAIPATIRRGSKGSTVKKLQTLLAISADGIFGPNTEAAVKRFQKAHKLSSDGIVGPATWKALLT